MNRHLISAADLSREEAVLVLDTAAELASVAGRPIRKLPTLRGRTVVNLFYEDSTRTRTSFEAAAKRLSADVINFSAKGSPRRRYSTRSPSGSGSAWPAATALANPAPAVTALTSAGQAWTACG